jgi:hypothetical protein
MMEVRKFPQQEQRVETGAVQFGDDWPGVFIRGDNALYYAHILSSVIGQIEKGEPLDMWNALALQAIRETLQECDSRQKPPTMICKSCGADRFKEDCKGTRENCPIKGVA